MSEKVGAVVDVRAGSLIAAQKRAEGGRNAKALEVKIANEKALTVLGNIVGGPIMINNVALGGPWQHSRLMGA